MKDQHIKQPKYLVIAYICTLGLLFAVVVTTPLFIRGNVTLTKKLVLEEDVFEMLLIATLLGLAYTVHRVYQAKFENLKESNTCLIESHTEAFKYIGTVNVQLQRLWNTFIDFQRYPETKNELQSILASATRNLRGIIDADWILIRIINQDNFRTITEHWESFADASYQHIRISNRTLAKNKTLKGFSIICSCRNNLAVNVACIIPVKALMREEKILIEAIVGELEMLFIIFALQYL